MVGTTVQQQHCTHDATQKDAASFIFVFWLFCVPCV